MNKKINFASKIFLALVFVFLFLPIAVIILMSFNESRFQTFPVVFSLKWYNQLFTKSELFSATLLSAELSLVVSLVSTLLGAVTAIGMCFMKKKTQKVFSNIVTIPIIIPWLVLAVALLVLFNAVGIGRSYVGMFFGNLVVCLPYVIMLVFARISGSDFNAEDAARTLGAKSARILFTVTLPKAMPAILSGGLMAFVVCFNNFVIQYYLAPFGVRTLPLEIYNMVRVGCEPDINALATIIILVTLIPIFIIYKLGISKELIGTSKEKL